MLTVTKFICQCSSVEQARISKSQLEALAHSIAQLIQTLDSKYRDEQLRKDVS